jgi:hypothetical protein
LVAVIKIFEKSRMGEKTKAGEERVEEANAANKKAKRSEDDHVWTAQQDVVLLKQAVSENPWGAGYGKKEPAYEDVAGAIKGKAGLPEDLKVAAVKRRLALLEKAYDEDKVSLSLSLSLSLPLSLSLSLFILFFIFIYFSSLMFNGRALSLQHDPGVI